MFRRLALASVLALVFGTSARADLFTTTATINPPNQPSIPLVNQIVGTSTGGFIFNNTTSTGSIVAPTTVTAVSVGADRVQTYNQLGGGTFSATANNVDIVKIFAVQSSVQVNADGTTLATIQSGGMAYVAIPTGQYNQFDPSSWISGASLLYAAVVVSPQNIIQSTNGEGGNVPAALVNQIAVNLTNPADSQGHFLVAEVFDPGNFIDTDIPALPPGFVPTGEGLHVFLNERVRQQLGNTDPDDLNNAFRFVDPAGPTAGAGLASLDLIAALFGLDFATGFGSGLATDFDPYNGPSVTGTIGSGDFGSLAGDSEFPGIFAQPEVVNQIPEPATMLVWGMVLATGGFAVRSRRKRAAA